MKTYYIFTKIAFILILSMGLSHAAFSQKNTSTRNRIYRER